jgi:hypothetical protein
MATKSTEGKGGGVLWCVSVALNVLWRHKRVYDGVGPKKLSSDVHTPKKAGRARGSFGDSEVRAVDSNPTKHRG